MERIKVENAAKFVFGETSRMVVGGETGLKYLRAGVFQKPPKRNKGRRRISLRTMRPRKLKTSPEGGRCGFFS